LKQSVASFELSHAWDQGLGNALSDPFHQLEEF
jgi:hypothetical protein